MTTHLSFSSAPRRGPLSRLSLARRRLPRILRRAWRAPVRRHLLAALALALAAWPAHAGDEFLTPSEDADPLRALLRAGGGAVELHGSFHEADDGHHAGKGRPDAHGPIGVMGDHMHHAGEWMLSLRAMRMHMDGMRDGGRSLSSSQVFAKGFMVTPEEMNTDMVMAGGMWAPTDDVTLMVMVPYVRKSMDLVTGTGVDFTTESEGLGDVSFSALVKAWENETHHVHWNLGVSAPTGSIDEQDQTPASMGKDVKLPYPMQLGSGTWDALPGVTYTGHTEAWSWGAQAMLRTPLEHENDNGYRQGNRGEVTSWIARRVSDDVSTSARLRYLTWRDIRGTDSDLNPAMVPTANPDLLDGKRLDLLLGVNWIDADAGATGNRLAFEVGAPVMQDLDGPQMEFGWVATLGWQKSF